MPAAKGIDWNILRHRYITGASACLRDVAEFSGVHYSTVKNRARKERWVKERGEWRHAAVEKALHKDGDKFAAAISRTEKLGLEDTEALFGEVHALVVDIKEAREAWALGLEVRATLLKDVGTALHTVVRAQRLLTGQVEDDEVDAWKAVLIECGLRPDDSDGNGRPSALEPEVGH